MKHVTFGDPLAGWKTGMDTVVKGGVYAISK